MRRTLNLFLFTCLLLCAPPLLAGGSRIKDLAMVAGARDNQLVGYGLVVGLAGHGNKNPVYTVQTLANLLQRYVFTRPRPTPSPQQRALPVVTPHRPPLHNPP